MPLLPYHFQISIYPGVAASPDIVTAQ